MIKKIEAKIKEKLESIEEISQVFDYYKSDFDSFPYAGFELIEMKWEKLDSCSNIRNYSFWVLIFQETEKAKRNNAKNILYLICEKIIKSFDSDEDLWGLVLSSDVVDITINDWIDDNKWKGLYASITLNFKTILCLNE